MVGDRAYAMGDENGLYPATGWHTSRRDGWDLVAADQAAGRDLVRGRRGLAREAGPASKYTSGYGYQRIDYGNGVQRTDFVPDGVRATVVGLTFKPTQDKTVKLDVDAHSELMPAYPWGGTTPNAGQANLPDTGAYGDGVLKFRDQGTSPIPNAEAHDYNALVGSSLKPTAHALGANHRGPQDPAVVCPMDGTPPARCDDSAVGKGTGGRLTYSVKLKANQKTTVWFAVAGSDEGQQKRRAEYKKAISNPDKLLQAKTKTRAEIASQSAVDLPGDKLLQQSVEWSKQNLADSVQEARDLQIRDVNEGKAYPNPVGTRRQRSLVRRRVPGLPVAVRDGRRVHLVRRGRGRSVRHGEGASQVPAGDQRSAERRQRQGRARDRADR